MRASRRHLILVPCAALIAVTTPDASPSTTVTALAASKAAIVSFTALERPQTVRVASTTTAPPTTAAPTTTTAPPPPPTTVPPPPPTTTPPTTAPPPPPEPEPAPAPQGSIEEMIYSVFGDAGAKAVQVARCESGLNPEAVNGQYRGLFQLGNYHVDRAARLGYSWDQMFQAYPNIVVAHDLYVEQGWSPWSCA